MKQDENNTSYPTIIKEIDETYEWFMSMIKDEYKEVVEGFYNILMFNLEPIIAYDSSPTTVKCIVCGLEVSHGCEFFIGTSEEDKTGPFCSKCMDDELKS